MRSILAGFLLFITPVASVGQSSPSGDTPPIEVTHCVVASHHDLAYPSGSLINAGLLVTFKSHSTQTFKRIVWRARYGDGWIDFNDAGKFSPEAEIFNAMWIRNTAFAAPPLPFVDYENDDSPADCRVVLTETTDGTIWSRRTPTDPPFFIPTPLHGELLSSKPGFNRSLIPWQSGLVPSLPGTQPADSPAISIEYCAVGTSATIPTANGGALNALLLVRFRSSAPVKYKRIIWRARYGNGWVNFNDDGEFSPNISITNGLWVQGFSGPSSPIWGIRPYQNDGDVADCAVMYTETMDGKKWSRLKPDEYQSFLPNPLDEETLDLRGDTFESFTGWNSAEYNDHP